MRRALLHKCNLPDKGISSRGGASRTSRLPQPLILFKLGLLADLRKGPEHRGTSLVREERGGS